MGGYSGDLPNIEDALNGLLAPERERLKFQFEQGTCAFTKLKNEWAGLVLGCHLDQHPALEILKTEGKWSIGRRRSEEG